MGAINKEKLILGKSELWVLFMCEYYLWVNVKYRGDTLTNKHTHTHTSIP